MKRCVMLMGLVCLIPLQHAAGADVKTVTWTGWFGDGKCRELGAISGTVIAPNPDCSKTCIEKGAPAVFLSEQAKAIFTVRDYPSVIGDLGYHVEVQAAVDESAKTISIRQVKRMEYQGASCSRPKKK